MPKVFKAVVFFFGIIFCVSPLIAAVLKIQLPLETGTFKPAPGAEMANAQLANAQCLTCHSVEYVQTQPPMPLTFWAAEVKKMRDKYGAQFPEEESAGLANYLARNYGTATNLPVVLAPVPAATNFMNTAGGLAPVTPEAFATKYGCLACHKINAKVVGPAFRDVAAKYRDDPSALDKIAQQIHHGGSGKWGSAVMPPYTMVTDAQAEMLGKWILSLNAPKQ
jgi:sulfite dehydrogenase